MCVVEECVHPNFLPATAKTRRLNTINTFMATGILPTYARLYKADIAALDCALADSSRVSTLTNDLGWYFVCWQLGSWSPMKSWIQQHLDCPICLILAAVLSFVPIISASIRSSLFSFLGQQTNFQLEYYSSEWVANPMTLWVCVIPIIQHIFSMIMIIIIKWMMHSGEVCI